MPELPEVESIRRSLEPLVSGRRIVRAEILDSRLVRSEPTLDLAARLEGESIAALDRRGKYLLVRFESGRTLVIHLRMTGSLRHRQSGDDLLAHERARLELDDGTELAYRDVRRFGTWQLFTPRELEEYLEARVGPEPLGTDFSPELLSGRLAGRRTALKAALLDQRTLAGLGNIYVDEALWQSRLHPLREAGGLERDELVRLHRAIRSVLRKGIARQGSTLRDYQLPDGAYGTMQDEFHAYGRGGEPCDRCGTPLTRIVVGGRTTTFCPRCQCPPGTEEA